MRQHIPARSCASFKLKSMNQAIIRFHILFALSLIFAVTAYSQIAPGVGRFGVSSSRSKTSNALSNSATTPTSNQGQVVQGKAKSSTTAMVTTGKQVAAEVSKANTAYVTSDPNVVFSKKAFLEHSVAGTPKTDTVTIHSSSSADYQLVTPTLSGPDMGDFTVTPCAPDIVSSNYSDCVITLTYSPTAVKKASYATLNVTLNKVGGDDGDKLIYTADVKGYPSKACTDLPGYAIFKSKMFLPLSASGIGEDTINCYYNTSSNFAFATQVGYQYSPGGSANTVSSDLFSLQFPGGVQLSLMANAGTGSCSSTATGSTPSTSGATSTSCGTSGTASAGSPATTTPSLQQDVQTLEQGGDFGFKALYPLFNWQRSRLQALSFATPRVGFTVNGLSATTNTTNATDINFNLANENYLQLDALPATQGGDSPGSIFVDYRWGYENISGTYQTNAKLTKGDFILQQLELGIVINGAFKISADRYFGPNQVYVDSSGNSVTANNFNAWSLKVQITPSSLKSGN